jgi:hypothetical protein
MRVSEMRDFVPLSALFKARNEALQGQMQPASGKARPASVSGIAHVGSTSAACKAGQIATAQLHARRNAARYRM